MSQVSNQGAMPKKLTTDDFAILPHLIKVLDGVEMNDPDAANEAAANLSKRFDDVTALIIQAKPESADEHQLQQMISVDKSLSELLQRYKTMPPFVNDSSPST
eukprot:m.117615 g.117615  ORF g.117615 m.117615 type:complete len:103 (+) comp28590_c0_seq5:807-1115(+)